jgi:hypothetical protein
MNSRVETDTIDATLDISFPVEKGSRMRHGLKHGHTLLAFAAFLLLTTLHTWPLATDPARLSRNDNYDTQINEWIVSWIAHQLPRDPLHLFDANRFHPERFTLAYGPPLLVPGILGAPLRWLGASPVLTYNSLLLLGMVLTGLATYHVVTNLCGDPFAGLLSGSLVAFNAHTLTRFPHLPPHYVAWLLLAFLAFDRLLVNTRAWDAVWLGFSLVLLALTSGYLGVFGVIAMAAAFLSRGAEWWKNSSAVLSRLGLAAGLSFGIVLPILYPYWWVHQNAGVSRPIEVAEAFAATLNDYLATAGRIHYATWSRPFYEKAVDSLFPGFIAIALALISFFTVRDTFGRARVRMVAAVGLVGVLISLGPATPLHAWLFNYFPPMRVLLATSRFGHLLLIAVAVLAGYGLAELRRRSSGRGGIALAAGIILLANLEALRAPIVYQTFEGISPVYRLIADDPADSVVVEMPFYRPENHYLNARYLLASTVHWKPLLNGCGFVPPSYRRRAKVLRRFPSEESISEIRQSGVTYVVVHLNRYRRERAERIESALERRDDFVLLGKDSGGIRIYRFLSVGRVSQLGQTLKMW